MNQTAFACLAFDRTREADPAGTARVAAALMNTINDKLERKGLLLNGGTMVDATITFFQ